MPVILSDSVLNAPLSARALQLFVMLSAIFNRTGPVVASHKDLAAMLGLSLPESVKPYLGELEALGFLLVDRTQPGKPYTYRPTEPV